MTLILIVLSLFVLMLWGMTRAQPGAVPARIPQRPTPKRLRQRHPGF